MGVITSMSEKIISKESTQRHDICKGCEHYRKSLDQCKVCGCIMTVKTKLKNTSCPKGKWGNNSWKL
jgi:hypothetical protein